MNGLDGPRYICETEVMEEVNVANATPVEYTPPGNHTNKNSNGNIITLTLKNNHLIVETEERAVSILNTGLRIIHGQKSTGRNGIPVDRSDIRYRRELFLRSTRRRVEYSILLTDKGLLPWIQLNGTRR